MSDETGDPAAHGPVAAAVLAAVDGVGLVLDREGTLRAWNDRFGAVTGRDDDALAGRTLPALVAGADRERVEAAVAAARAGGRTTVEADLLTDAGTTLPYELVVGSVGDDGSPRAAGAGQVLGVARPVGDRVQLRERLAADPGVARLFDHCLAVDAAVPEVMDALIGYGRERLDVGYGFLTRIDGDVQEVMVAQGTHELLQAGESCPLSEAYCRKTIREETMLSVHDAVTAGWEGDPAYETFELGSYIGAKVRVEGSLFGTLCFADTDPRGEPFSESERRVVELLAAWTSRALAGQAGEGAFAHQHDRTEAFASMVSHDLRNPLSVAMGVVQAARTAGEPLSGEELDSVADSLDRMEALVEDVLALVRGGATVESTRSLDAEVVARAAWGSVDTADATLSVEPFAVEADPSRLQQLFENLFRNAVEHGGPDVSVRVDPGDGGFQVADDGPGIPDEERERVFERGFSTDSTGTGLGLNIVRSIAGAHGWRVHVEESAEGGARFVVADADVTVPAE
jgi:PAS domain S-box-containing protein